MYGSVAAGCSLRASPAEMAASTRLAASVERSTATLETGSGRTLRRAACHQPASAVGDSDHQRPGGDLDALRVKGILHRVLRRGANFRSGDVVVKHTHGWRYPPFESHRVVHPRESAVRIRRLPSVAPTVAAAGRDSTPAGSRPDVGFIGAHPAVWLVIAGTARQNTPRSQECTGAPKAPAPALNARVEIAVA